MAYDFTGFRPAYAPLAHVALTPAERELVADLGAGPLLWAGDYLTKAAHTQYVVAVRRGTVTTYWVCPPSIPTC